MSGHVETIPLEAASSRLRPMRRESVERPVPSPEMSRDMPGEMWDVAEPGAPPVELAIAAAILLVLVLLSPLL